MTMLIQVLLALVFGASGALKLYDLPLFARTLHGYNLLPGWAEQPASVLIALSEVALSLWLLSGVRARSAAAVTAALLAVFSAAIAWAWMGGYIDECGCILKAAGVKESAQVGLVRNGVLIALSGVTFWRSNDA